MRWNSFAFATVAALALVWDAGAQTPSSYHVTSKIPLSDGGWDYASVDNAGRLYLPRPDRITAIDLAANSVTDKLATVSGGHGAIAVKGGTEILAANGTSGEVTFIDAKTGAILATLKAGTGPDAVIGDSAAGLGLVMNHRGGTVTVIDIAKHAVVGEIEVGGALEFAAVDSAGRLFVNVEDKNEIAAIDLKTNKVISRIKLEGCDSPAGLAYLDVSKKLLSSCANGVAAIVDPAKLKLESLVPIGTGPDAVFYDHMRKKAFIPCGRSGDLAVFSDTAKGVVGLGKVPTQIGARTGAVDEKTGRVYLPAAEYAPPAAAGGRPQMKPGSVVVVVLEP